MQTLPWPAARIFASPKSKLWRSIVGRVKHADWSVTAGLCGDHMRCIRCFLGVPLKSRNLPDRIVSDRFRRDMERRKASKTTLCSRGRKSAGVTLAAAAEGRRHLLRKRSFRRIYLHSLVPAEVCNDPHLRQHVSFKSARHQLNLLRTKVRLHTQDDGGSERRA